MAPSRLFFDAADSGQEVAVQIIAQLGHLTLDQARQLLADEPDLTLAEIEARAAAHHALDEARPEGPVVNDQADRTSVGLGGLWGL